MTEERWDEGRDESPDDDAAARPPAPTGVRRVDAVLDDVTRLDGQPLKEHVAAFEKAHDELRRTLDDPSAADAPPAT